MEKRINYQLAELTNILLMARGLCNTATLSYALSYNDEREVDYDVTSGKLYRVVRWFANLQSEGKLLVSICSDDVQAPYMILVDMYMDKVYIEYQMKLEGEYTKMLAVEQSWDTSAEISAFCDLLYHRFGRVNPFSILHDKLADEINRFSKYTGKVYVNNLHTDEEDELKGKSRADIKELLYQAETTDIKLTFTSIYYSGEVLITGGGSHITLKTIGKPDKVLRIRKRVSDTNEDVSYLRAFSDWVIMLYQRD